jgi:hypothetical protein
VVHRDDDRPILKHALPVNDTKMKKQAAYEPAEMITNPIVEIHLRSKRIASEG